MSKDFMNSDKLATGEELNYILNEVLAEKEPIALNDLSRLCKERSLNLAFAFEDTLSFLQHTGIIKIGNHKSVSRSHADDLNTNDLMGLLLQRTMAYLGKRKIAKRIFNEDTISTDEKNGNCVLHTANIPVEYPFVKIFLLNSGIARIIENSNGQLLISATYKKYITETPVPTPASSGKKPTFFISYANSDKHYKEQLQNHLSGLVNLGLIESWDGSAIMPGTDWDAEVKQKLEQAKVVMFLISSDFMASDYINNVEINNTMERHRRNEVKIIPVLVRPCDYTSLPIGRYQILPTDAIAIEMWSNKDSAYLDIVKAIKKVLKDMQQ